MLASISFLEVLRAAWIGDDAAITLRTMLNLINGVGPVFNVNERVHACTHPLWFFLICGLSLLPNVFACWLMLTRVAANLVSIGGDLMEGRFFTAPLLAGAIVVSRAASSGAFKTPAWTAAGERARQR